MLVDDHRPGPAQSVADLHHRPGQRDHLAKVGGLGGEGGDEGGELDIGITFARNVPDDRADPSCVEPVAVQLGAHRAHRFERLRMADGGGRSVGNPEPSPDHFGQSDLVRSDDVVADLVEGGDRRPAVGDQLDHGARGEPLRPRDGAVDVHQDKRLVLGLEPEPANAKGRLCDPLSARQSHVRSTVC